MEEEVGNEIRREEERRQYREREIQAVLDNANVGTMRELWFPEFFVRL